MRVGDLMLRVLAHVRDHPGCTKGAAAVAAAGRDQRRNGYGAVDRCEVAGLLSVEQVPGPPATSYALRLTDLGRAVIDHP